MLPTILLYYTQKGTLCQGTPTDLLRKSRFLIKRTAREIPFLVLVQGQISPLTIHAPTHDCQKGERPVISANGWQLATGNSCFVAKPLRRVAWQLATGNWQRRATAGINIQTRCVSGLSLPASPWASKDRSLFELRRTGRSSIVEGRWAEGKNRPVISGRRSGRRCGRLYL